MTRMGLSTRLVVALALCSRQALADGALVSLLPSLVEFDCVGWGEHQGHRGRKRVQESCAQLCAQVNLRQLGTLPYK